MKKGEKYTGTVVKLKFPNRGIVRVDDTEGEELVMVKNVLPGQKVSFFLSRKHSGLCEGNLCEVIEKAPYELKESYCPHFGKCGGCAYQNISYDDQLKIKEKEVLDLLAPFVDDSSYLGIVGSPAQFEYKNKMEFSFGDCVKGGELTLGLHKKGSFHDIINVPECRLISGDMRKILTTVLEECQKQGLSYYHRVRHEGLLRHLVFRSSVKTGDILLNLVTTSQVTFDVETIKNAVLALPLCGRIKGFIHTINDSLADTVQADRMDLLYGENFIYEDILGLKFKISPFSFFQTNPLGAEKLYDKGREFILSALSDQGLILDSPEEIASRGPLIFDLYSGTGTIAQLLSPVARKVIGVEIVEEAVEAAKANAELNGLTNCEFLADDVLKALDNLPKPDFIVLDPPREGIHPKALPKLLAYGVRNFLYISCKPTSLANDLIAFTNAGYKVSKCTLVDMFPGTNHVESVCLLSKVNTRD